MAAVPGLTTREAATIAEIPERTLRRWVKSGRLAAARRGHSCRIPAEALAPIPAGTGWGEAADRRAADAMAGNMAELLRMPDERDRTILELSGRVGYLQAHLEQARETLGRR